MSNIDWDFIGELEGKRILNGYVPTTKNMKSGVTIATGFDLGQRNEGDLSGLPKALIDKLKPYLGIKGAEAKAVAGNLNITDPEAKIIDEFSHGEVLNDLRKKWKAKTGKSFDDLPMHKATVVASVRFQHGDLATKTPNFWRQTTTGDWQGATENLRNFQDEHPRRRNKEADYLTKGRIDEDLSSEIESTLAKTAPPDAPSRQLTDEQLIESVQMPDIITEPSKKKLGEPDAIPQIMEERVSPTTVEMDAVPEIRQTITEPVVLPDLADDLPIIEKPQLDVPTVGPNEKPKSYYQLPKQADIESSYTSLYGEPNTVYGDRIPSQLGNQDQYDYDIFDRDVDVLGAAFRQYNIFSALGRAIESSYADFQPEEGYSAYNDKALAKKIGGADMLYMFRHNNSHAESMQQLENMQEDYEDMKILNAHESTAAELAAGLASPVTLLPLAPMRVLKMASPVKRFVGGTAFTAAAVMPEQMIIESQNEYRDASHSALMLSALSLVGGALTAKFGKNIAATTPPRSGGGLGGQQPSPNLGPMSPGPSSFTVFRGSGGESKVSMPTIEGQTSMAMGDNIYYSSSKNTASMYGKNVSEVNVTFDQPLILKTDDDLLSALSSFGIKTDFVQKYERVLKAQASFESKVNKKTTDELANAYGDFNESLHKSVQELEKSLKANGYDGVIVKFGVESVPGFSSNAYGISGKIKKRSKTNFKFLSNQFDHDQIIQFKNVDESKGVYKSAGAGVSPERYRQSMYATMEQEALEETGVGLEKVPWNPVLRMAQSQNPFVRSLAPMMVNMGGLMQKKVRASGEKMADSVEAKFTGMYMGPLLDSIRDANLAYLKYRGVAANKTKTDIGTSIELVKLAARDKLGQTVDYLSETQFRIRVGKAMRNGDVDTVADDATEAVNAAAQSYRKTFNLIKEQAESVRLFEAQLVDDLGKARAAGDTAAVSRIEEALRKLQEQGVTPNNAKSYLPRIYRVDMIMKHQREFLSIIADHARRELGLRGARAEAYAQEVMDTVTRNRPFYDADEVIDSLDFVKNASGVQARTLDIDDMRIEKFLENDAEVLLRHHVKTMGMDIELTRAFGSVTMKGTIDEVVTEYKRLIDEAADPQARATLSKQMEDDLRDIRGLRDRLRGTYGASKDPHAMSSRFIRTMKSFNVFTSMGSAMISSVPDVARTVMVEGFTNTYEKGFRHLFNKQAEYVKAMKRRELRMAGVAADAVLGLRAHAFSDVGDLFGSRYGFERGLNKATGMFFMMNGLNYWNQVLKEFAGNVTMLRMTDSLMRNWDSLKATDREKFLKNGIDRQDHYRMAQQIRQHGKRVNGEWMPNTDSWTDPTLRLRFRMALNQNVERIIITPGAGDRALWTSTEMGSFLTQFKSYGQGAMIRMLTSGLQEKDGAFWQGAFLLVGLAALVNEIKKAQYGIEGEESFDEKLINAVDRSGILGWSMDVNNALEKMSDYKLGMRPFLTDQPSFALPETAKAGAVFGPGISNIMNATKVMGDVVTFNADQSTADTARFLTPTGNIPYLDPLWDGLYGQ